MVKDGNKRISINFSDSDLNFLEEECSKRSLTKSQYVRMAIKNMNTTYKSDILIKILSYLEKKPLINIKYYNDLYLIYTVGLEDDCLKVLDLLHFETVDYSSESDLYEEIEYYLYAA